MAESPGRCERHPQGGETIQGNVCIQGHVHTGRAWQEKPGTRMGENFKEKDLDPNHPQATTFVDWIRRLLA